MKHFSESIKKTIQQKRLYNLVKEVSSYHRIQASTGFREAANYCKKMFDKLGIEANILSYDANPDIWYLQNKMFMEWDLKHGWLQLQDPEMLLADTSAEPVSIIQKSYPCDFTDGVDFVYLNKGNDPKEYENLDLTGKLVFVRGPFAQYMWAVKDKGAVGFVTDFINAGFGDRTREQLYESINYTSFWWSHTEDEPKCFGFVLSPKMGDWLAKQFEGKESLRCTCKIEASLYPGKIEVVEAKLPGETDEEVLICAHLCHPKSSCNDNASGVTAAIESLTVLKQLMNEGKLPKNKRTIKVILVPEFTGTYAYLHDHNEYQKCVGAINLDMVGGKQTRFYGPITLTSLPYSTPSFINDLSALCMEYASKETPNLSDDMVAYTNHTVECFTGGSDHTVFSDPTIGIPCCMLGQWPDLNYHTATDTLDVIDPAVLAYSCHIATLYAYTLSNLDEKTCLEVQVKQHELLNKRLNQFVNNYQNELIKPQEAYTHLQHIKNYFIKSVEDYARVVHLDEAFVNREKKWIETSIEQVQQYLNIVDCELECKDARVFKRTYVSPIQSLAEYLHNHEDAKNLHKAYTDKMSKLGFKRYGAASLIEYYIDGKRTISDIIQCVNCDLVMDSEELVIAYVNLLEKLELIVEVIEK